MQFRTVAAPDGAQLDALIVPVFKEGGAASGTPAADRETAEWVAREQGSPKIFSTATHLRHERRRPAQRASSSSPPDGARNTTSSAPGKSSAPAFARCGRRPPRRSVSCLETQALPAAEAVQAAVEGTHFALWRPDSHRTGEEEHPLPPIDEVLLIAGDAQVDADDAISRGTAVGEAVNWARIAGQRAGQPDDADQRRAAGDASSPRRPVCRSRSSTRTPVARWAWAATCPSPTAATSRPSSSCCATTAATATATTWAWSARASPSTRAASRSSPPRTCT